MNYQERLDCETLEVYMGILNKKYRNFTEYSSSFFKKQHLKSRILVLSRYFLEQRGITAENAVKGRELTEHDFKDDHLEVLLKHIDKIAVLPDSSFESVIDFLLFFIYALPLRTEEERIRAIYHRILFEHDDNPHFPFKFFSGAAGQKRLLRLTYILVTEILKWDKETAQEKLTKEILTEYRLKSPVFMLYTNINELLDDTFKSGKE